MISRRHVLTAGTGAAIAAMAGSARDAASQQAASELGRNRLILLGTRGGPAIRTGYAQTPTANLIVYNGVPYLIDTGYGVSFKLVEA